MNEHNASSTILTPAEALQRYREELCQHDRQGNLVVLPGVIGTLFFQRGSKPDVRQGILACFDRFEALFGAHLKGGKDRDKGKFTRRMPQGVQAIRKAILETAPEDVVSVVRSSATNQDTAAAYQIETLTNRASEGYVSRDGWSRRAGEELGLSWLRFNMPMDILETAEGIRLYEDFLRFVCEQLPVCGGYGGLSPVLPYFFHPYMPQEWELARRFSGLEIDSYGFIQKNYYDVLSYEGPSKERNTAIYGYLCLGAKISRYGFIKSVNWYTIIDELFIDRLGGEEAIRAALARPDIHIEQIRDCLLIRAGDFPRLGAPEEGLPEPYVFVNSVLRVLRDPHPDSLHTYIPDIPSADVDNTVAWEARFDLPDAPSIPEPPQTVPLDQRIARKPDWLDTSPPPRRHRRNGGYAPCLANRARRQASGSTRS